MIFPVLIFKLLSPCSSLNRFSALKSNALFRWIFVRSGVKYMLLKISFSQLLSRLFAFNICLFWSNTSTVNLRGLHFTVPSELISLLTSLTSLFTVMTSDSKFILFSNRLFRNSRSSCCLSPVSVLLLSGRFRHIRLSFLLSISLSSATFSLTISLYRVIHRIYFPGTTLSY